MMLCSYYNWGAQYNGKRWSWEKGIQKSLAYYKETCSKWLYNIMIMFLIFKGEKNRRLDIKIHYYFDKIFFYS